VRGAFTGAVEDRIGKFELASGGTLFLDEVGDLGPRVQAKLLRTLQERQVERVGETSARPVDVRIICATHHTLEDRVARGDFREDLFYRLAVVNLHLPPLRKRREDIPVLVRQLLAVLTEENALPAPEITRQALQRLIEYDWPGNVRQLRNVLENMITLASGSRVLDVLNLPDEIRLPAEERERVSFNVGVSLSEVERILMERTLRKCDGDKPRAARMLGVSLRTLYRRLRQR
jgi:transcriptional regulator with PAS, ATPase and Fis domain